MRAVLLSLALLVGCKNDPPAAPAPSPAPTRPAMTAPMPVDPNAPPTDLVKGANQLALELWAKAPPGNLAISPASIAITMAVTWGGARGTTADQIGRMLHLPPGPADIVLGRWGNLGKSLVDGSRGVTLKTANRLYVERSLEVDTTYFTIARHAFDVWVEPVDFSTMPDEVRARINTWVAEQTEQRIRDLIPPNGVSAATKLVVVNAIYFLGTWAEPFDPAATKPRPFWIDGTTETPVPTMTKTADLRLARGKAATLVELPYATNATAMYVLVPDAREGLVAVEKELASTLRTLQGSLAPARVALQLPKFTIDPDAPLRLQPTLQALGVKAAFDPATADFSGMLAGKEPLFISDVVHKAFVKVDEKGTEAAAATAAMVEGGGMPAAPEPVVVDRPFLFFIVDNKTGLILFVGRVVAPT